MNCKEFWSVLKKSGLTPELEDHLKSCESCSEEIRIENLIISKAGDLPAKKAPSYVWDKIIAEILESDAPLQPHRDSEHPAKRDRLRIIFGRLFPISKTPVFKPALAMFAVLFFIVGAFIFRSAEIFNSGNKTELQAQAIVEIENTEKEYLAAIDKFRNIIDEKSENDNSELYLLYKRKLGVLDEVILLCREAINENQYNLNARLYLVEAYKEKVETLKIMSEISS